MPNGAPVLTGKPRVSAGLRDARVTIQAGTWATTDSGVEAQTWADLGAVEHMSRLDARADERVASHQDTAFMETVWKMVYREDMDPDLVDVPAVRRLVYSGRIFNIVAATKMGRYSIELLTLAGSRLPAVPA